MELTRKREERRLVGTTEETTTIEIVIKSVRVRSPI